MTTPSPAYYTAADRILAALGAVATPVNVSLLVAWQIEEHGWASMLSCHNPLNTTWRMPGSTDYNATGVQCYLDWGSGIEATVRTLTQSDPSYGTLVAALRSSNAYQFFQGQGAAELRTWSGGDPTYASSIAELYHHLPAVPAVYWSATPTSSGGSPAVPALYRITPNYWILGGVVAVSIVILGYAIQSNRRAR
jgi:hypothetical protein